jgi:hypothetical protein
MEGNVKRAVARLVCDNVLVICDVIAVEVGCGGSWLMREGGKTAGRVLSPSFYRTPKTRNKQNCLSEAAFSM